MHRKAFQIIFAASLLLVAIARFNSPARAQDRECPAIEAFAPVQAEFLGIINAAREQAGAGPLVYHPQLSQAAELHSQDMALQNYFSHTGQDGSSPGDRAQRVGYPNSFVGENILVNSRLSAQRAFDQWWNSPGHKANMLKPQYNITGLGMACGDFVKDGETYNNYIYYTQTFAQGTVPDGGGNPDNPGNSDSGSNSGASEGGQVVFGEGALTITLPTGWSNTDNYATDNVVWFWNADETLTGYTSIYSASESGVDQDTDLVELITAWGKDLGTVMTDAVLFTTNDGLSGASVIVSTDKGYSYVYMVFNPEKDSYAYGEFQTALDIVNDEPNLIGEIISIIQSIRI
jgi:uncharacterized protein YkwD